MATHAYRVGAAAIVVLGVAGCRATAPSGGPTPATQAAQATNDPFPVGEWVSLFDGKTLAGTKILDAFDFAGRGKVEVADGVLRLEAGSPMTGVSWPRDVPRDDYEVSLEAMRTTGGDFFCGLTFPVGKSPCTLILGGWGGNAVGLSNVDDQHAAENETTTSISFENNQWYRVRLRVTQAGIDVWVDDEHVIELERAGRKFDVWWEQEPVKPLGVATWFTGAALRDVKLRRLAPQAAAAADE